jgi:RNA polymerase sigma-70 factor (ECF subfamily)
MASLIMSCAFDATRLAVSILRDTESAKDAVQQAALRAWAARGRMPHDRNTAAWFSTIVVNTCRDELRRRAKQPPHLAAEPSSGDFGERLARREEVGRAIASLSPDQKVLVGLRFGRDLTVPQIAALTGLREGTVKSRLHGTIQRLRAKLEAERHGDVGEQT